MRLKESLALLVLLLITVSGVFGQDNDPKSSTPAPTPTPAPVTCKTRDPVTDKVPKDPEISDVFEMIAEVTQVVSYCLIIQSHRKYSLGIKVDCTC